MLRVADAELLALKLLSAEHADTRQLPETVKLEIPILRHKGLIQLDAGGWTLTAEGERSRTGHLVMGGGAMEAMPSPRCVQNIPPEPTILQPMHNLIWPGLVSRLINVTKSLI